MSQASPQDVTEMRGLQQRLKALLIDRLKLDLEPEDIGDSDPLFGEGLGLDSIDALELVLGVEQEFGVKIEDEEVGAEALASVESLARFVASKQAAV
jgi:acyl carrier protein